MSQIQVGSGGSALGHAERLAGISRQLEERHGGVGALAGAAPGTRAEDTVQGSFDQWGAALPQFALAAERMLVAMAAAAAQYRGTDDVVAHASGDGADAPGRK